MTKTKLRAEHGLFCYVRRWRKETGKKGLPELNVEWVYIRKHLDSVLSGRKRREDEEMLLPK